MLNSELGVVVVSYRRLMSLLGPFLLVGASHVSSQTVQGRVFGQDTGEPVAGALVKVLDDAGTVIAAMASGEDGSFSIAISPTANRLLVERIGFQSEYRAVVGIPAGTTVDMDVGLTTRAFALDGIEVTADNKCESRPQEGVAVYELWNEARKALENAVWTQEAGSYTYRLRHFTRELSPDGRSVRREQANEHEVDTQVPFKSVPVDQLMAEGFADIQEGVYYAPDADVLLSDEFAEGHCFELAFEERPAVRFRPLRGNRAPDIDGTVWFRDDGALGGIEFRYVNLGLPDALRSRAIGGAVDFEVLPNGLQVVSNWSIKMPMPGERQQDMSGRLEMYLRGIQDVGATVVEVRGSDGPAWARAGMGAIAGVVYDSLAQHGLEGARVSISSAGLSATTDRLGRFELGPLSGGRYDVNIDVAYLREAGFQAPFQTVEVADGQRAQLSYTAPRRSTAVAAACSDVERPIHDPGSEPGTGVHEMDGILVGYVSSMDPGLRMANRIVRVTWSEYRITPGSGGITSTEQARLGMDVMTDEFGFYRACWVPTGVTLQAAVITTEQAAQPVQATPAMSDVAGLLRGRDNEVVIRPGDRVGRLDIGLPTGTEN